MGSSDSKKQKFAGFVLLTNICMTLAKLLAAVLTVLLAVRAAFIILSTWIVLETVGGAPETVRKEGTASGY